MKLELSETSKLSTIPVSPIIPSVGHLSPCPMTNFDPVDDRCCAGEGTSYTL